MRQKITPLNIGDPIINYGMSKEISSIIESYVNISILKKAKQKIDYSLKSKFKIR